MQSEYQRRMCELLSLYSSGGALIGLKLVNYVISDEIALVLQPALAGIIDIRSININEFLMRNPQLKKLTLKHCSHLDDSFLQSIVAHLPQLEKMHWKTKNLPNEFNIQYFGRMTNLRSLEIVDFHRNTERYITRVIREIIAARIPLEHLRVSNYEFRNFAAFVYGIEGLNTLKELEIRCMS